jgi:hypothetical protein
MLELRSPSNQIRQVAFAATAATTAKVPFIQNSRAFIPVNDADAAAVSNHVYRSEVSGADKATGEAWAVGQAVYFNATTSKFTTTTTGATLCGYALEPALAADTVSPLF